MLAGKEQDSLTKAKHNANFLVQNINKDLVKPNNLLLADIALEILQ